MLIQTNYNQLPDKQACNNGTVLYGASVSNMAGALSQLSHVKFLGMCNYQVMRSSFNTNGYVGASRNTGVRLAEGVGGITKGYTEDHKFFYASTLISSWLCVVVAYESGSSGADPSTSLFSPVIEVSIKELTGSPLAEGSTLDHGIRLDSANSLRSASVVGSVYNTGEDRVYFHHAESNIDIPNTAPVNTSPVEPRPLYIPSANRGEVVSINVSCEDCKLRAFTLFDLYQPEVAP